MNVLVCLEVLGGQLCVQSLFIKIAVQGQVLNYPDE